MAPESKATTVELSALTLRFSDARLETDWAREQRARVRGLWLRALLVSVLFQVAFHIRYQRSWGTLDHVCLPGKQRRKQPVDLRALPGLLKLFASSYADASFPPKRCAAIALIIVGRKALAFALLWEATPPFRGGPP
eukprot:scaffold13_cov241-Pinguiococcus_pyrenoidosus.AAC.48